MTEDEICPLCGLPKSLCVCTDLSADEQEIIISNDRRKWKKIVTLISFGGNTDADLKDLLTKAKRKIGAGGTIRENSIELMGDHRFKIKKFLIDMGYDEDRIRIQE
ncbi:MAG: stress response translation initiation inhibitor YciH [Candidatus Lokiarchaeota archaeon]|nr:stress response translation initiation inhibitor YciH [Candidatus Lokiarchaeota archaeon]